MKNTYKVFYREYPKGEIIEDTVTAHSEQHVKLLLTYTEGITHNQIEIISINIIK